MFPFYSYSFLLIVASAIFFYRAGVFEGGRGFIWAALSVAISLLIWRWLHWGLLELLFGQIVLFVGIGIFRKIPNG
jgi:hypothetical protein